MLNEVLAEAGVQKRLRQLGFEPTIASEAETARFSASEVDQGGTTVRALNLSINLAPER